MDGYEKGQTVGINRYWIFDIQLINLCTVRVDDRRCVMEVLGKLLIKGNSKRWYPV